MPTCKYSIVLPIYNEADVLPHCYERLSAVLDTLDGPAEMIFVNDGSSDNSLDVLRALRARDQRVKFVNFARNFGQERAMIAGMDYCGGEAIIIMDADLQDPPELIPEMVAKWKEGYEVVYAQRPVRHGESHFKILTARFFYRFLRRMASITIPPYTGNFRLIGRRALNAIRLMREQHLFFRGNSSWVGFRQTSITYIRPSRVAGYTKYDISDMVSLAKDGAYSFSSAPLEMATHLGFAAAIISGLMFIWVFCQRFIYRNSVEGWASIMSAILFLGAVQLICIGILGEYLARVYDEVRRRPLYLVDSTEGLDGVQSPESSVRFSTTASPAVHDGKLGKQ